MENAAALRRVTLESIAIVGSILLAFAIDAWWEASRESQRRIALLGDLKTEVLANIDGLAGIIRAQELYNQNSKRMVGGWLGEVELTPTELAELGSQLTGVPTFIPSWGMLDLLTASGDLLLLEDAGLRTKLANLKSGVSRYTDNQELALEAVISDVSKYETGELLIPYDLPNVAGVEGAEDPAITRLQLEKALKSRQFSIILYENLLRKQAQGVLEKLQEIATLLP